MSTFFVRTWLQSHPLICCFLCTKSGAQQTLSRASCISITLHPAPSWLSKGTFLSFAHAAAAASLLCPPAHFNQEKMKTRHLLNVWRYLFSGSFAMCALLEKRPYHHHKQVWNGVSNNAPDSQNQTENAQIVPGPESTQTALDFDGQMSLESARCAATSTITQQPTATDVDCQPTSCVARASVRNINSYHITLSWQV